MLLVNLIFIQFICVRFRRRVFKQSRCSTFESSWNTSARTYGWTWFNSFKTLIILLFSLQIKIHTSLYNFTWNWWNAAFGNKFPIVCEAADILIGTWAVQFSLVIWTLLTLLQVDLGRAGRSYKLEGTHCQPSNNIFRSVCRFCLSMWLEFVSALHCKKDFSCFKRFHTNTAIFTHTFVTTHNVALL